DSRGSVGYCSWSRGAAETMGSGGFGFGGKGERTEYQLDDMFTKALPEDRFKYFVRRIGIRCLTSAELENRRDLTKDTPKLELAVLRYDGDECDKGIMPTKIELTLEQSQQGVSNDVLVSIEGVE
nr:ribonuclease H-like domain-containing protein [Tanacetum cinerariifolium]